MRRTLSLILVLFFSAGQLAAALQSDDLRLPPCCRRNGAHHCSMPDSMIARMAQLSHGKPILTAPARCPFYPHNFATTLNPTYCLALSGSPIPALRAQAYTPVPYRAVHLAARLRSHSGLSPPALQSC